MQTATIPEILGMDNDDVVKAFRGRITWASKYFPADEEKKKQAFQIITLTRDGTDIKAMLRNRAELPNEWMNRDVWLIAHHSDRGWTGLRAKDNTWKNKDGEEKTDRVLWVTATCEMTLNAPGVAEVTPENLDHDPASEPKATQPVAQSQAVAGTDSVRNMEAEASALEMLRELSRLRNTTQLIMRTLVRVTSDVEVFGFEMTPELIQAMHATYLIHLDKLGMVRSMGTEDIGDWLAKRDAARKKVAARAPAPVEPKKAPVEKPKPAPLAKEAVPLSGEDDDVPF